jgi:hypothetical protein
VKFELAAGTKGGQIRPMLVKENVMVLTLTDNEVSLITTALAKYSSALRDEARVYCSGYSEKGIALCQRRMEVDLLVDGLETHNASGRKLTHARQAETLVQKPYVLDARAAWDGNALGNEHVYVQAMRRFTRPLTLCHTSVNGFRDDTSIRVYVDVSVAGTAASALRDTGPVFT